VISKQKDLLLSPPVSEMGFDVIEFFDSFCEVQDMVSSRRLLYLKMQSK
jgi:hypothetical protein